MIKIRLEGTPEELDKAILHLEADEQLNILNISGFYPNKHNSLRVVLALLAPEHAAAPHRRGAPVS